MPSALGMTRTSGTQFRKLLLYPPELQGQFFRFNYKNTKVKRHIQWFYVGKFSQLFKRVTTVDALIYYFWYEVGMKLGSNFLKLFFKGFDFREEQ